MGTCLETERNIDTIVAIARKYLVRYRWDEIEAGLAEGWGEFREGDSPPWSAVAAEVRRRSEVFAHDGRIPGDNTSPLRPV